MNYYHGLPPRRKLTGRLRLRKGWFGRIVVEVEVRLESPQAPPMPGTPPKPPKVEGYLWEKADKYGKRWAVRPIFVEEKDNQP